MKLDLEIYELGQALKKLEKEYSLDVLVKMNLSGGWMTMNGSAEIESVPKEVVVGCSGKSNNIIDIRVKTDNKEGALIKITGAKNKVFNIDIASTRYKELSSNTLTINQIKVNNEECKLRIGEDIIFTIKATVEEVINIIQN
ncbi:hypothetical protein JCM1393_03470 [Clostridium carnis]